MDIPKDQYGTGNAFWLVSTKTLKYLKNNANIMKKLELSNIAGRHWQPADQMKQDIIYQNILF